MSKFRKKPIVVEAVLASEVLDGASSGRFSAKAADRMPDWIVDAFNKAVIGFELDAVLVNTLEGQMRAGRTDWIIRGVQGEIYPCKPEIFTATYDRVEEEAVRRIKLDDASFDAFAENMKNPPPPNDKLKALFAGTYVAAEAVSDFRTIVDQNFSEADFDLAVQRVADSGGTPDSVAIHPRQVEAALDAGLSVQWIPLPEVLRWEVYRCPLADSDGVFDSACGIREVDPNSSISRMVVSDTGDSACCHHIKLADAKHIVDLHNSLGQPVVMAKGELPPEQFAEFKKQFEKQTGGEPSAWRTPIFDAESSVEVSRLEDALETAWGVVANVSNGNWNEQSTEWQEAAKRWRDECYHPMIEDHAAVRATLPRMNAAEAVYGIMGWLTSRDQVTTLSAHHNAGDAADLAAEFVEVNQLGAVTSSWPQNLTHPTSSRKEVGDASSPEEVVELLVRDIADLKSLATRNGRQFAIALWTIECFGEEEATSIPQRALRLLEEAIECAQAAGVDLKMAHKLVDFVYDRPVGEIEQEIGGVSVTLLALAAAVGTSAEFVEQAEVERVLSKSRDIFTQRNAKKNAAGFKAVK